MRCITWKDLSLSVSWVGIFFTRVSNVRPQNQSLQMATQRDPDYHLRNFSTLILHSGPVHPSISRTDHTKYLLDLTTIQDGPPCSTGDLGWSIRVTSPSPKPIKHGQSPILENPVELPAMLSRPRLPSENDPLLKQLFNESSLQRSFADIDRRRCLPHRELSLCRVSDLFKK